MMRTMLKSKLHRLTVTDTNINYEGSITIDKNLIKVSDILPGERVQVVNLNNGERFETYVIEGGKGVVCLNGAAARLAASGDKVIVIAYATVDESEAKKMKPKIVLVNERNKMK
ncbi:MAG: aspartate 1-decarboxylase [bacterium]